MAASTTPTNTVEGTLFYIDPPKDGSKPSYGVDIDPITGQRHRNFTLEGKKVQIENVRGREGDFKLDVHGFQFVKQETSEKEFKDDKEIEKGYYEESAELLKKATGASRVIIFDHTIRRVNPEEENKPSYRGPALQVHADQTPAGALVRLQLRLPEEAEQLSKKRYQIINLWRPISHPAVDTPLTLCDYQTVNDERDLLAADIHFTGRKGENYTIRYSDEHRWKYLQGMNTDEVVLIKCFDNKEGVAKLTPHTAFVDPTTPPDAPRRQSIELRAFAFYD